MARMMAGQEVFLELEEKAGCPRPSRAEGRVGKGEK